MAEECVYGFPCVENPHNFTPDSESCTAKEIEAWKDAKRRWDAGERDVRGARCRDLVEDGKVVGHITATSWGIGVNTITVPGDCCNRELEKAIETNPRLSSGTAQEGDEWTCPECSTVFVHICDEGCWWDTKENA